MRKHIFFSYRRLDSPGITGRIYDRLLNKFGPDQIFLDTDSIEPATNFVEALQKGLENCEILIAIIGKSWVKKTEDGISDFVLYELRFAFKRNIPILPVLVEEAKMPLKSDLPEDLAELINLEALQIDSKYFNDSMAHLIEIVETKLRTISTNLKSKNVFFSCVAFKPFILWSHEGKFTVNNAGIRFIDKENNVYSFTLGLDNLKGLKITKSYGPRPMQKTIIFTLAGGEFYELCFNESDADKAVSYAEQLLKTSS